MISRVTSFCCELAFVATSSTNQHDHHEHYKQLNHHNLAFSHYLSHGFYLEYW